FGLAPEDLTQQLKDTGVVRWREPMPLLTADNTAAIAAIEDAAQATDRLDVTGAWFAGTGRAPITQPASSIPIHHRPEFLRFVETTRSTSDCLNQCRSWRRIGNQLVHYLYHFCPQRRCTGKIPRPDQP